jgi:hypothetical protein
MARLAQLMTGQHFKFDAYTPAEAAEIRHLGKLYKIPFDQAKDMVAPVRVNIRAPSLAQLDQWLADQVRVAGKKVYEIQKKKGKKWEL